jgi:hypothetical protein
MYHFVLIATDKFKKGIIGNFSFRFAARSAIIFINARYRGERFDIPALTHFHKNRENYMDEHVRGAYGTLCSICGICLNILLFAGKYFAGVISAPSRLPPTPSTPFRRRFFRHHASGPPSRRQKAGRRASLRTRADGVPFGRCRLRDHHRRRLRARSRLDRKILSPTPLDTGLLPMAILVVSICVKLYMFAYNRMIGKKINSPGMRATAADSLSDSVATTVVLISMLISRFFGSTSTAGAA